MGDELRVQYGDNALRELAENMECRSLGWEPEVVTAYRRRLQSIAAAEDRRDLRALASLDLRPVSGSDGLDASLRLTGQARLVVSFDVDDRTLATVKMIIKSETLEVSP